jgi:hypothetical protein
VRDFSDDHLREGLRRLIALVRDETVQHRCRETAEELFSLEGGIASYDAIYRDLGAAE